MDQIESKLNSLALKIPPPLKVPPDVKTSYIWIGPGEVRSTSWVMDRENPDGSVAGPFGKVGTNDVSVEQGYEYAKLAGLSILGSLKRELGRLGKVEHDYRLEL